MQRLFIFLLGTFCGVAVTLFCLRSPGLSAVHAMQSIASSPAELDPLKLSPQLYKLRLDNDRVRVYEYHLKPGEKEPMHSHPAGVVYVASGGTMRATSPDGKSAESEAPSGEVIWRNPTTHALENIGHTEAAVIGIDLKPCPK